MFAAADFLTALNQTWTPINSVSASMRQSRCRERVDMDPAMRAGLPAVKSSS